MVSSISEPLAGWDTETVVTWEVPMEEKQKQKGLMRDPKS